MKSILTLSLLTFSISAAAQSRKNEAAVCNRSCCRSEVVISPPAQLSDARYKKNIRDSVPGLTFVLQLHPVTYNMDVGGLHKLTGVLETDSASLASDEAELQTGFIAQEVERAADSAGYRFSGVSKPRSEHEPYGLRYATFVVPLVKAVQEQHATITALQAELARKTAQLMQLELRLMALESRKQPVVGRK